MKAEIVAKKGQRERIHPVWDGPAYLMDTAALSLVTQAVWMAWLLGCLLPLASSVRAAAAAVLASMAAVTMDSSCNDMECASHDVSALCLREAM